MEIQKRCKYCGGTFIAHKMTTIYCSPSCNNKDYKQKIREKQIADYQAQHPIPKPATPKSPLNDKQFLTPREAAKVLGVGKSTVYRELASGLIKAIQLKGITLCSKKYIIVHKALYPIG
ncbi:MAG: excisionase family DNA-binding protein [Muribaculaceae bacterium]|nr:excisionase family DNA-binding protein [Muribaculaceae bacterium]